VDDDVVLVGVGAGVVIEVGVVLDEGSEGG
jgi:hypothetical protein